MYLGRTKRCLWGRHECMAVCRYVKKRVKKLGCSENKKSKGCFWQRDKRGCNWNSKAVLEGEECEKSG